MKRRIAGASLACVLLASCALVYGVYVRGGLEVELTLVTESGVVLAGGSRVRWTRSRAPRVVSDFRGGGSRELSHSNTLLLMRGMVAEYIQVEDLIPPDQAMVPLTTVAYPHVVDLEGARVTAEVLGTQVPDRFERYVVLTYSAGVDTFVLAWAGPIVMQPNSQVIRIETKEGVAVRGRRNWECRVVIADH